MAEEKHRVTAVNGEEVGGNNNNNTTEEEAVSIRNTSKVESGFLFTLCFYLHIIPRNQPAERSGVVYQAQNISKDQGPAVTIGRLTKVMSSGTLSAGS